jgi:hypothetical protein
MWSTLWKSGRINTSIAAEDRKTEGRDSNHCQI